MHVGEFAGGVLGVGEFDGVDAGGVGRAEARPFVLLWHDSNRYDRRAHLLKNPSSVAYIKTPQKKDLQLPFHYLSYNIQNT